MTTITIRPGDTLEMITGIRNIKGVMIEKTETITYEALQDILQNSEDTSKKEARRSYRTTPGAALSRKISMFARAIDTGKWSNGIKIDKKKVAKSFVNEVSKTDVDDFKFVKPCVMDSIEKVVKKHHYELYEVFYSALRSIDIIKRYSESKK